MSKYNVYMCQVNNTYGDNVFLPYAAGIIVAYNKAIRHINENFNFKKILYLRNEVNKVIESLENPRVFGFSCYVWNYEYCRELAKRVKSAYPECTIVFGGPQVPDLSDEFFKENPYVDILIHGEGEKVFSEIFNNIINNNLDYTNVNNISINVNGEAVVTSESLGTLDLNTIPSPYLDGTFDEILQDGYSFTASLETNRGCPYSCSYCDWGSPKTKKRKLREFDMSRIEQEIEWFGKNKIELIFCCDSNFGILPRDYEIINKLIEVKKKYGYPQKFRATYAKNSDIKIFEMTKVLNEFGMCKGATLSFQSMNDKTLDAVKRLNIKVSDFSTLMKKYTEKNIPTYTEIIQALPEETYDTFCDGIDTLIKSGQHTSINIYNCEVLPNAEMGSKEYQEKYGIKTVKIPVFLAHSTPLSDDITEYTEIVIETNSMSLEDWKRACLFSWAVQCFHCLSLTQYIAIYLYTNYQISYRNFYNEIIKYAMDNPHTIIGEQLRIVNGIINKVIDGGSWDLTIEKFGKISWPLEEGTFLNIVCNKDKFYKEINNFVNLFLTKSSIDENDQVINQLINYQSMIIFAPFDSNDDFEKFDYDFKEYFYNLFDGSNSILNKKSCMIKVGKNNKYANNLEGYAQEVIWYGRKGGKFTYSDKDLIINYLN